MRVCLIDASPDRTRSIQCALQRIDAAIEMDTFTDGATALEALTTRLESPDLILLDLALPGHRGIEVLVALTAEGRSRAIPVVVLTADRDADLVRAYELGASGDITAATLVPDLQVTVAHTRLYWQALTRPPSSDDSYSPPSGSPCAG